MKYLFYAGKTFFDSASHVPFKNYGSLNNTEKLNCRKLVLLERFSSKNWVLIKGSHLNYFQECNYVSIMNFKDLMN